MCARVCSSEQSVFVTQGRRLIHIEQGRVRLSASLVVEGGGGGGSLRLFCFVSPGSPRGRDVVYGSSLRLGPCRRVSVSLCLCGSSQRASTEVVSLRVKPKSVH